MFSLGDVKKMLPISAERIECEKTETEGVRQYGSCKKG